MLHRELARQVESHTPGDDNPNVRVIEDFDMNAASIPHRTGSVYVTETPRQTRDMDNAFEKLATALQEGFALPKPELLTFSGNSIDYCKFIKNFETNVESRVSDYHTRLSYLIQYCKGEAKSSIEDCVLLEPKEGYLKAREILFSRYGRSHLVARSFIEKILYGNEIKASNVNELSKLALEMQKCEITLSQLGFKSDIDNSDNLRRIVRRLPTHLRPKWVDVAHSITESGREPRFSDLSRFVDEKARISSSMFGLDLVRENSRSHVENKVRHTLSHESEENVKDKVTTLVTQSKAVKSSSESCCSCCSGTRVDLGSCRKFKLMGIDDRFFLLRKLK